MICPDCKGAKQVTAHVNYGGRRPNEWKPVDCPACRGTGEVAEDFLQRREAGFKLRLLRTQRNESLYECAKRGGLSSAELSDIEHGRADPARHPYYAP